MTVVPPQSAKAVSKRWTPTRLLRVGMLTVAAIFFAAHFLHLNADFPNKSPWVDWAKYTDEGWYGDGAIRHYLTGHWYWEGDFNPAVALPMLPLVELIVFRFTGVSPVAARAMTLCFFGLMVFVLYVLVERYTRPRRADSSVPLAAPLMVLFLCLSPFLYVFERMAIIEPLLILLMSLALLTASRLHPLHLPTREGGSWKALFLAILPSTALGILLPSMVLAKTTAVALFPAVGYLVWARSGYRFRRTVRMLLVPGALTVAIWLGYFLLFVRPHYLKDYQYLFAANAYTGIELEPLATVVLNTLHDGLWMGVVLFPVFFFLLAVALFFRPHVFTNPLIPSLLLWVGGYFAFLMYHNNLQPRYYTIVAVPITALVALGLDQIREAGSRFATLMAGSVATVVALAIAIPDAVQQVEYIHNPTYDFFNAAQSIKQIVSADKAHPDLVLSISGSDLTLMTGMPSIDDDFGTDDLDVRVAKYHPGWYVAWNDIEDDKMDALRPLYQPVRVASFPAMDDPDRDLLILYRLDPRTTPAEVGKHPHRERTPKPLVTKIGQQPSTNQLEH